MFLNAAKTALLHPNFTTQLIQETAQPDVSQANGLIVRDGMPLRFHLVFPARPLKAVKPGETNALRIFIARVSPPRYPYSKLTNGI